MDFLSYVKDPAIVAGIIGVTEFLKGFLMLKSKKVILAIPFFLGLIVGGISAWGVPSQVLIQGVIYAGVSSFVYQFGKVFIPEAKKDESTTSK